MCAGDHNWQPVSPSWNSRRVDAVGRAADRAGLTQVTSQIHLQGCGAPLVDRGVPVGGLRAHTYGPAGNVRRGPAGRTSWLDGPSALGSRKATQDKLTS